MQKILLFQRQALNTYFLLLKWLLQYIKLSNRKWITNHQASSLSPNDIHVLLAEHKSAKLILSLNRCFLWKSWFEGRKRRMVQCPVFCLKFANMFLNREVDKDISLLCRQTKGEDCSLALWRTFFIIFGYFYFFATSFIQGNHYSCSLP